MALEEAQDALGVHRLETADVNLADDGGGPGPGGEREGEEAGEKQAAESTHGAAYLQGFQRPRGLGPEPCSCRSADVQGKRATGGGVSPGYRGAGEGGGSRGGNRTRDLRVMSPTL